MEITGIADEGSLEIEEQIKIHKELGWNSIELRLIGRTNVCSIDVEELKRAAPRMRQLKTKYIRIMSYPNDGLQEKDWRREAIRRISELSRITNSEGVILVHENCSGWGGAKPEDTNGRNRLTFPSNRF